MMRYVYLLFCCIPLTLFGQENYSDVFISVDELKIELEHANILKELNTQNITVNIENKDPRVVKKIFKPESETIHPPMKAISKGEFLKLQSRLMKGTDENFSNFEEHRH